MSKSKRVKVKEKKVKKETSLVPVKRQEKALVIVEKKKMGLATICKKEAFQKVIKSVSIALIGTALIAYIGLMVIVATSIFYVSHLENGFIQKGVLIHGISVANLTR